MYYYVRHYSFSLSYFLKKKMNRRKPLIKCSINYTSVTRKNFICQQQQKDFYRTNTSRIINVDAIRMDNLQNS